ncbi:MAG: YncE family protein [Spirochaetales bacterium]|nr:YncE family protein [Spirochaetales bacterium]
MKRGSFLTIFLLGVLGMYCRSGSPVRLPAPETRQKIGSESCQFLLQPYQKTTITVDNELQTPRILSRDKTMATIEISWPRYKDGKGSELLIEHADFAPRRKIYNECPAGVAMFLNTPASRLVFENYLSSGKQPKSVTFIDDRRIVIPYMLEKGAEVIHILSGERTWLRPPEEWARHTGFVESLVLPGEIWISQMYISKIHVFDRRSLAYKTTISLSARWPKVLTYDAGRNLVYASNWGSHDISVIDPASHKELRRIKTGGVPRGMLVMEDGTLFAAQFGGENDTDGRGLLLQIDVESGRILNRYGRPGSKRHIARGKEFVYVSDMSDASVDVFSRAENSIVNRIAVYSKPNTIVLSPDQKTLFVSCRGPNNPQSYLIKGHQMGRVYLIDTVSQAVTEYREGGNQPTGLDVSPDGLYLASSDFLDAAIRIYRVLPGAP